MNGAETALQGNGPTNIHSRCFLAPNLPPTAMCCLRFDLMFDQAGLLQQLAASDSLLLQQLVAGVTEP
jgi:hypothetical protein